MAAPPGSWTLVAMDDPAPPRKHKATADGAANARPDDPFLPGMSRNWLLPLYDPLVRLLGIETHHRQLVDIAELRAGERVLEIGCGTGNLALLLTDLHPEVEVVGIDPDRNALARARRKAHRRRLAVELHHGFAQRLPFPDASFDRVVSAFMFHHLAADVKPAVLSESRRVLKAGSALHLVDFGGHIEHSDGLAARLQRRHHLMADNVGDRISQLLQEAGFADATEVAHRVTRVGRITHYRASVREPDGKAS